MSKIAENSTVAFSEPGKWLGRIIVGVLLGEAVWNLIVSAMNNIFVPWLGDMTGSSSGLPSSFTQRPYNYPDFFVSVWEACVAALVAAVVNYFFQRRRAGRPKPIKAALVPQVAPAVAQKAPSNPVLQDRPALVPAEPPADSAPPIKFPVETSLPPPPVAAPRENPPAGTPPIAESVLEAAIEPPKTGKQNKVYYNIVGDPIPSDDDR